jgi:hypothetical protein
MRRTGAIVHVIQHVTLLAGIAIQISGYGIRTNAVDQESSYSLYPDAASGTFDLVQNGVGTRFQVQASGAGAVKAGTGAGVFVGAPVATVSGANVAIPGTNTSGLGLTISSSPTTGKAACINSVTSVVIGNYSTHPTTSRSCTFN